MQIDYFFVFCLFCCCLSFICFYFSLDVCCRCTVLFLYAYTCVSYGIILLLLITFFLSQYFIYCNN